MEPIGKPAPPQEFLSKLTSHRQVTAIRRVASLQVSTTGQGPDRDALRKTRTAPATRPGQAVTAPTRHDTVSIEAQDDDESVSRYLKSNSNLFSSCDTDLRVISNAPKIWM